MDARIVLLIFFSLVVFSHVSAQKLECGTPEPTAEQIKAFQKLGQESIFDFHRSGRTQSTTDLAIAAHIIRQDDGTGGLSQAQLNDAIANANEFYANAGLSFFVLTINYIDDSKYYDFVTSDEPEMTGLYNYENTINIYFANSVGNGDGGFFCGYAYFPGGPDVILMDNGCTSNGSTFPHEIGHFFALYHTHGLSNSELTDELVTRGDGANCGTAGDQLCDTEADPNVSGQVNSSCQYTGSEVDANGDAFVPDATNIMSYSTKACRNVFSDGQYSRMNAAYTNNRNYLRQTNYIVDFEYDVKSICTGQSVAYSNTSINADSYLWEFQGGTPATSTEENPSVTYETPGEFNVSLTITSGGSSDVKTIESAVRVDEELNSTETSAAGSFESDQIAEKIINDDNSITWAQSTGTGTDGDKSVFMNFYNYQQRGEEDYLVFAVLNTTVDKVFELTFDYAYSGYSADFPDGLSVVYRGSCEPTWQTIFSKEGLDLQTTADFSTSNFTPTSTDWRQESLTFEVPDDKEIIEVAFVGINGWGNNLYVDNYSVAAQGGSSNIVVSTLDVIDASCPDAEDGSITIEAEGNGPFNYNIDDGAFSSDNTFTDLAVGQYVVGIEDADQNVESINVEVSFAQDFPDKPTIEIVESELFVQLSNDQEAQWYLDGELIAGATGSALNELQEGSYTVEVAVGTCASVSDPLELVGVSFESISVQATSCPDEENGSISLEALGTPPYEFSIDGGEFQEGTEFVELSVGSYSVAVRNLLNSPVTESVEVSSENEYPEKPTIINSGDMLSVDVSSSQDVQWYFNDEQIVGATSSSIGDLSSGVYSVEVSNGSCATLSDPLELTILGFDSSIDIRIVPNPVSDFLKIEMGGVDINPRQVFITDLAGKILRQSSFENAIDVADLNAGIYIVQFELDNQKVHKRFVKR